jgi:hypothetical protein
VLKFFTKKVFINVDEIDIILFLDFLTPTNKTVIVFEWHDYIISTFRIPFNKNKKFEVNLLIFGANVSALKMITIEENVCLDGR